MSTDLTVKKGKIVLEFGRSYHYKGNNGENINNIDFDVEIEDIESKKGKYVERIKGLAKYNPKDIEDMYKVEEDIDGIIENLLDEEKRLGSLIILKELREEGFSFREE